MPSAHPDNRTADAMGAQLPGRTMPRVARVALLLLVVALTGCGGAGSSSDSASAPSSAAAATTSSPSGTTSGEQSTSATSSTTSTTAAMRTVSVSVTGRKVSPPPGRVDLARGESLLLVVTVDHDDQLHVHGFDVEEDLEKGVPLKVTLTGGAPGLYDVETHHPELRLLQIAVR